MAEGEDDKARGQGTLPPPASRAEHAARKLGLRPTTSGRFDTVKSGEPKSDPKGASAISVPPSAQPSARPPAALVPQATQPSVKPPAQPSTKPPASIKTPTEPTIKTPTEPAIRPAPEGSATSAKDAMYAARRSLVAGEAPEPAPASKPKRAARPPLKSPIVLGGGALLLLGALVLGTMMFLRWRYDTSDEGRVRGRLTDVEFAARDTAARDAAWADLDGMPKGPATAVQMLVDTKLAERGSSRSTHKMQELANQYLIHFAATKKVDPPPKALETTKLIFEGTTPNADHWLALQQSWRAWLDGNK
jgi:hypothetical protein